MKQAHKSKTMPRRRNLEKELVIELHITWKEARELVNEATEALGSDAKSPDSVLDKARKIYRQEEDDGEKAADEPVMVKYVEEEEEDIEEEKKEEEPWVAAGADNVDTGLVKNASVVESHAVCGCF